MAVSKKLIIGDDKRGNPDELFAIAKVYAPTEAQADAFIDDIEALLNSKGFTTERYESTTDGNRHWKIAKV